MLQTNFTRVPNYGWAIICVLLMALSYGDIVAQPLACNNLVQISIDDTPNVCQVEINADMILEGDLIAGHDYGIEIKYNYTVIASGTNEVLITDASQWFGKTLTAIITDLNEGNSCWGSINLEDKMPPVIDCGDITVECSEDPAVTIPNAVDNCDANPTVQMTGETTNTNTICSNGYATITRTFVAIDDQGNTSNPCIQTIYVERPDEVDFPEDIVWHCDQYADFPGIVDVEALNPLVTDTDNSTPNTIDVSANLSGSILGNTGSGIVSNVSGIYCKYQTSHSDQLLETCGGTFKIVRTWTALDWCTNTIVTSGVNGEDNLQIIKVVDSQDPTVERADFNVSATFTGVHPNPCKSQSFLLPPSLVSDNCSDVEVKIFTPVGEVIYANGGGENGGFIPSPGLGIGQHSVIYQVTDACGNQTNLYVTVTVVDDIVPLAICDEITDVNVGSDGKALIPADVFDDGSYDNCCMDRFEIRRMDNDCNISGATTFGPKVVFCCEDIGNEVTVVFRAVDCDNNTNECMVSVFVNDKIDPTLLSCPDNDRVTCEWYAENLETDLANATNDEEECEILTDFFGKSVFRDNCEAIITCNVTIDIDQCLEGRIRRTFRATDPSGNTGNENCIQTIFVDHVSDWVVEFPADKLIDCGADVPDFGEPEIFFETCEMIAVSYEDTYFNSVPDACFKIVRDWSIINWCVVGGNIDQEVDEDPENGLGLPFPLCDLDGDGDCDDRTFRDSWTNFAKPTVANAVQLTGPDTDPDSDPWDGYIIYQQTIKVTDSVDPVFANGCDVPDVCIDGITCSATFILPTPNVDECSPDVDIVAEIQFGNSWSSGFGPYIGVAPGQYNVRYVASDNCNNQAECETIILIKDCKKPTPYCKNGLVVELMVPTDPDLPMVDIWALDFNEGSFDNCPGLLKFSFSPNVGDVGRTFTCDDVGQNTVEIWVTDASGNQDYCETFVIIQSNMGQCGDDPIVAASGMIANEDNEAVENVTVNMNGQSTGIFTTGTDGVYTFANIPTGNDITITPVKDDDPLNGVTTYDLVLISKHILGIELLDSPYKILASDANHSNTVTTFDLVEIRKLILMINTDFPNNTSWRFVEKAYGFPDTANPWAAVFPEVINYNNLSTAELNSDFVAVKIGDVNGSAATNLTGSAEDRTSDVLNIEVMDKEVMAGEEVVIPFYAEQMELIAYQFTLNFDQSTLELQGVGDGIAKEENFGFALLDEGAITAAWYDDSGIDANADQPLFGLIFTANESGMLSKMLDLNSRFTIAEAYQSDGTAMDVQLNFNTSPSTKFELYQNTPNPFNGETVIGFNLPEGSEVVLTITDFSGRVLTKMARELNAGYNEIKVNSTDFPTSGVFYYTLESATETATRKMIVVE